MPIYAFRCEQCGHEFDRLQKLSDPDPDTCPECAKPTIRRKLSAPQFRLAGSGWYETDFKKDSDRKRNLAGGVEGGKSDSATAAQPAAAASDSSASPKTATE
ncbi:zinc ribbon domain-containing protein [Xanthomonadaceae bacterium XH05]|nr:zinc ribbon domain-containing protein [Xanthomonadaceae bacterium XH05]